MIQAFFGKNGGSSGQVLAILGPFSAVDSVLQGSLRFPSGGTLAHPFPAMNHTQPPKLYNDWNLNITPK